MLALDRPLWSPLIMSVESAPPDLTPEIRRRAIDYIAQYNLSGQDAIHLASALNAGVTDLASFDGGFRRVEGVHLWNDLIHAK